MPTARSSRFAIGRHSKRLLARIAVLAG